MKPHLIFLLLLLLFPIMVEAQINTATQQIPDLKSLPDVTLRLQKLIEQNNGNLQLPGQIKLRITAPLEFELRKHGAVKISASEGATLIMDGPGPALKIVGSHEGTASPKSFKPDTWNQRMPIISDIEILGSHPMADGIELQGTVGAIVSKVSVRWCRHGIHLVNRNRNVIVSSCHLYENSGVGVFLDDVNLHQINITSSHVSYNRGGGVVVRDGNVRNVQISGCDIEGNMPADDTPTTTANVLIDVSGSPDDKTKSIAEVSITGCTIQHSANYSNSKQKTTAPGGANIRLAGKPIYPIDSVTITGNVLSDTTTNIDINHSMDVAISANNFFAPKPANLTVANSKRVNVSGNTFKPRQFARPGTILFTNTHDSMISSCTIAAFATDAGAVIIDGCSGITLNALNLSDCGSGFRLRNSEDITISNCRVTRTSAGGFDYDADRTNKRILLTGNTFRNKPGAAN